MTQSIADPDLSRIASLLSTSSHCWGDDLYRLLVMEIGRLIDADYCFISLTDAEQNKACTLMFCEGNTIRENFEYELKDTPCESLLAGEKTVYSDNVCKHFPDDEYLKIMEIEAYIGVPLFDRNGNIIGLLAGLYKEPVEKAENALDVFEMFTGRIVSEIENEFLTSQVCRLTVQAKQGPIKSAAEQKNVMH